MLLIWLGLSGASAAAGQPPGAFVPLIERTAQLTDALREQASNGSGRTDVAVRHCDNYPYGQPPTGQSPVSLLLDDLADGLHTGLRCLSGAGPMGRLHQYHEYQANRLLNLFESARTKTFQCVDDAMFATAVATGPGELQADDPLYAQLRQVDHPAVILDTYRLGGLLSRRLDDETYRKVFHLDEDQIIEHRSGQPLRGSNLHRYRDRAALLFHEAVHWLGHEHSAIYPDLAHLYDTCCFGGSDYIDDPARNRAHQQTACNILKDDTLWAAAHHPYRQMRLWRYLGYDGFKSEMRADYAR
ncbi:MAG: hypothetical protein QNJ91_14270 [Gammaproteobacteria bacterium]|nr:hypothetical protein [Gammaproteobacteria bacterium]